MAKATLKRAAELKIRRMIRRNDPTTLRLLRGFVSSEKALSKLSPLVNEASTGTLVKRCLQACQARSGEYEAFNLLMWIYAGPIERYCSNVGQWHRDDAEQEGLLAVIEAAQSFKPEQYATRCVPEAFRKAIIARIRASRYAESRQCRLSEKVAEFLKLGFFCGEEISRKGRSARGELSTTEFEDIKDVVNLLVDAVASENPRETLKPWVRSRLLGESMVDYARRESPDTDPAKFSVSLRKQIARLQTRLQRRFRTRRAREVAIECLWLAGRQSDGPVAISRLEEEASVERRAHSRKRLRQ